jgi:sulfur-oxidizing protein SoxX
LNAPRILCLLLCSFVLMLSNSRTSAEAGSAASVDSNSAITADAVSDIEKGRSIAFNRNLGNCLACHFIAGAELPGNIAPPLIQMKLRFPDRAVLRTQIWDASTSNAETVMPPYGRHGILTEQELDLVVDFVQQL